MAVPVVVNAFGDVTVEILDEVEQLVLGAL